VSGRTFWLCLVGCEAVVGTDSRVGGSIYSKSRWALVTPNREGSGGEHSVSRDCKCFGNET
jgi:hypothetical protein